MTPAPNEILSEGGTTGEILILGIGKFTMSRAALGPGIGEVKGGRRSQADPETWH